MKKFLCLMLAFIMILFCTACGKRWHWHEDGRLEATDDLAALRELGYDGNDWIGRTGVEAAFEEYLKGTDGRLGLLVDA